MSIYPVKLQRLTSLDLRDTVPRARDQLPAGPAACGRPRARYRSHASSRDVRFWLRASPSLFYPPRPRRAIATSLPVPPPSRPIQPLLHYPSLMGGSPVPHPCADSGRRDRGSREVRYINTIDPLVVQLNAQEVRDHSPDHLNPAAQAKKCKSCSFPLYFPTAHCRPLCLYRYSDQTNVVMY